MPGQYRWMFVEEKVVDVALKLHALMAAERYIESQTRKYVRVLRRQYPYYFEVVSPAPVHR